MFPLLWKIAIGLLLSTAGFVILSLGGALALGYAVTMDRNQRDAVGRHLR